MGLNPFRSPLTKKKKKKAGTLSLEIRPIFLSSESIDIPQRGTYVLFTVSLVLRNSHNLTSGGRTPQTIASRHTLLARHPL